MVASSRDNSSSSSGQPPDLRKLAEEIAEARARASPPAGEPPVMAGSRLQAEPVDAALGNRIGAFLIDWTIIVVFAAIAGAVLGAIIRAEMQRQGVALPMGVPDEFVARQLASGAVMIVVAVVLVGLETLVGRWPGKWLLGLGVAGLEAPPTVGQLLLRGLIKWAMLLATGAAELAGAMAMLAPPGMSWAWELAQVVMAMISLAGVIGLLVAFGRDDRRALHDLLTRTRSTGAGIGEDRGFEVVEPESR